MPDEIESNVVRLIFENWNSLSPWREKSKVRDLNSILRKFVADFVLGVEVQVQWDVAQRENKSLKLDRLLLPGKEVRSVEAFNRHESNSRSQYGGTAAASLGRLNQFVQRTGSDPHGLGRWCWIQVGSGSTSTYIVTAYMPVSCSNDAKLETVYNQHRRYFRSLGDNRCPRTIFVDHLGEQIALWKAAGEQVLLFTDANSDVYEGILAQRLARDDIRMVEQCHQILGHKSPPSHIRGQLPISGIFATSGIVCKNVLQSAHGFGIGDHRTFVLDVDLASLIGEDFPSLIRLPGRNLQASKRRISKAYNRRLRKSIIRHKLIEKYDHLRDSHLGLSEHEKQVAVDKLDAIKSELMKGAEKSCRKRMVGRLANSPMVSKWLKRQSLLKWIRRHLQSPLRDPRNLFKRCKVFSSNHPEMLVKQPRDYTLEEIEAQIIVTSEQISALEDIAPELRFKHLASCKSKAEQQGLDRKAKEIAQIISRERIGSRFKNMKRTTKTKKGGGKVFKVDVEQEDGSIRTFNTQEAVEAVVGESIGDRYRLAYSAPIMTNNKLLSDVGFTGDGPAVQAILNGTYVFPPDTDPYTKLLFTEATVLFCSLGDDGIEDWVQSKCFTQFWMHAREATESSKSLLHFGHYKAGAQDPIVTKLHVSSLNCIRECGVGPTRWRSSLTVLLEKVFGIRLISKLRAICLLEADFNWLNKLIFAHRLEAYCRKHNIIPPEQFARSKTTCEEASLVKNLISDNARILHNSLAITSADLDQCFDRANGPITGVAAQAHGVSLASTRLMLNTMQLMQYFIKSGFGVAKTPSFGGSHDSRLMGLGQGSGAAPIGMRCVITLADNAYKRLGHGINITSSISARVFILAAIIYVDDTDLLHWGKEYGISDADFLEDVQRATFDWSKIVQATGGAIKPSKCFWYLLSWKFKQGKPILKDDSELPNFDMCIDQPDGTPAPIPRYSNDHTKKTLGVWNNPLNHPKVPLEQLKETGLEWTDALQKRPLERQDVRLSLVTQQYPKWGYGLSSLYASPDDLDDTVGSIYFRALPSLGYNRNINSTYRTLPNDFQGANLRQWSIEKLGKDISLLHRHWDSNSTVGQALHLVFESFQMETGLSGNIFDYSFAKYGFLATHSWFKILWEYLDKYQVRLEFNKRFHIPLLRIGDKALMNLFFDKGYDSSLLTQLNRVRKFLRLHSLADILRADGCTVDSEWIFTRRQKPSSRTFSWEKPTPSDFAAWEAAIRDITSASFTYSPPLGAYTATPHRSQEWFASEDLSHVYHSFPGGYDTFLLDESSTRTRSGSKYHKISTSPGLPPQSRFASVVNYACNTLSLHSTCPSTILSSHQQSLLDILFSFSNSTLWEDLHIDDDGEWLWQAILNGTLTSCNDGSFMKEKCKSSCSGAFILHCTATKKEARGCFVDKSPDSSNYRGELLGSLGPLLLIRAAYIANKSSISQDSIDSIPPISLHCDNRGVLFHGNAPHSSLKAEQTQADLIRLLKSYTRSVPLRIEWHHVNGHADKFKPYHELSHPEQLNVRCDRIAKKKLKAAISSDQYIDPSFPDEDIVVHVDRIKTRSSIRRAIYKTWGRRTARSLFSKRDKVSPRAFDLIYWDCIRPVMESYPPTFQDWVTRHVSDFNGCNRYLARFSPSVKNICQSCNLPNEDTAHIVRCTHPLRSQLYQEGVSEIISWLKSNHTPPPITKLFKSFLRSRGSDSISESLPPNSPFLQIAQDLETIGLDNTLVGRIPSSLIEFMSPVLLSTNKRGLSSDLWARNLAKQLLLFTHRQWIHRCTITHYKPSEGKTVAEHDLVNEQVKSLLSLSPLNFLPQHRHLITSQDFLKLGSSSTSSKQLWIAEVESALTEASLWKQLKRRSSKVKITRVKVKRGSKFYAVRSVNSSLFSTKKTALHKLRNRKSTQN